ncbi:MAG: hypothetical protein ACYTHJ_04840 [Planctomycetota bacterium]
MKDLLCARASGDGPRIITAGDEASDAGKPIVVHGRALARTPFWLLDEMAI